MTEITPAARTGAGLLFMSVLIIVLAFMGAPMWAMFGFGWTAYQTSLILSTLHNAVVGIHATRGKD